MVNKKTNVDMSAEAVTARIKLACGLGDAERLATVMRSAMAEIEPLEPLPDEENEKEEKSKRVSNACIYS